MKIPFLNRFQRESIYLKTTLGAMLTFNIACKKLGREISRSCSSVTAIISRQNKGRY